MKITKFNSDKRYTAAKKLLLRENCKVAATKWYNTYKTERSIKVVFWPTNDEERAAALKAHRQLKRLANRWDAGSYGRIYSFTK
jgi:hypothetical protein